MIKCNCGHTKFYFHKGYYCHIENNGKIKQIDDTKEMIGEEFECCQCHNIYKIEIKNIELIQV